jgi:hypothetical protein
VQRKSAKAGRDDVDVDQILMGVSQPIVLVQREMESLRAPLASITPFFGWQFAPPKTGGRWQRGNGCNRN